MNDFKFSGLNKMWSNRFLVLFILFLGSIGAFRVGIFEIDNVLNRTSIEIFGETNNVSNTMFSFIINENPDKYQLISFPAPLLSQLFNLIPSIVFPGKTEFMYSHQYVDHFHLLNLCHLQHDALRHSHSVCSLAPVHRH